MTVDSLILGFQYRFVTEELMFSALAKQFFGSANERKIKPLWPAVGKINALEPRFAPMSDEELKAMTPAFKERLAAGETLDDLLPEAFAVVREAAKRTLGQRHFDVQLVGGIVLHNGNIAEMKTGEGKTWSPPCRSISTPWRAKACMW